MTALDLPRRWIRRVRSTVLSDRSPTWFTSPVYAGRSKAVWHNVHDRMPNHRAPIVHHGALVANLREMLDPEFPEMGVLEIPNALLYGLAGWVFSEEGYLLPDHSWYGMHVHEMKSVPRFLPQGKRIKGVCLSLASDFAVGNFGHFLLDCLPRLDLFQKAGFGFSDVDHVFCPKPNSANALYLFEQLGIPLSKCIWANTNDAVRADILLAPSFPGTRRNYPSWVPVFLRDAFVPVPPAPSRRLYISRSGYSRNPANEDAVNRILISHGFEIYTPTTDADSHRDFAEAAIVVGPHGAGLSGLAFCQPGTKVLELIPTDHVYPYYYTLSDSAGFDYGCLVCRSTDERSPGEWGPSRSDFIVDEHELDSALDRLTRGGIAE